MSEALAATGRSRIGIGGESARKKAKQLGHQPVVVPPSSKGPTHIKKPKPSGLERLESKYNKKKSKLTSHAEKKAGKPASRVVDPVKRAAKVAKRTQHDLKMAKQQLKHPVKVRNPNRPVRQTGRLARKAYKAAYKENRADGHKRSMA